MNDFFFLGFWSSVVFTAFLLHSSEAIAGDVVVMTNGDRITGEVNKIWYGEVFIEPEYGDEFSVEMTHVSSIRTDEEYEIVFRQGWRTEKAAGSI